MEKTLKKPENKNKNRRLKPYENRLPHVAQTRDYNPHQHRRRNGNNHPDPNPNGHDRTSLGFGAGTFFYLFGVLLIFHAFLSLFVLAFFADTTGKVFYHCPPGMVTGFHVTDQATAGGYILLAVACVGHAFLGYAMMKNIEFIENNQLFDKTQNQSGFLASSLCLLVVLYFTMCPLVETFFSYYFTGTEAVFDHNLGGTIRHTLGPNLRNFLYEDALKAVIAAHPEISLEGQTEFIKLAKSIREQVLPLYDAGSLLGQEEVTNTLSAKYQAFIDHKVANPPPDPTRWETCKALIHNVYHIVKTEIMRGIGNSWNSGHPKKRRIFNKNRGPVYKTQRDKDGKIIGQYHDPLYPDEDEDDYEGDAKLNFYDYPFDKEEEDPSKASKGDD